MRGARGISGNSGYDTGIIPADAGSTSPWGICLVIDKDHPRRCGEHSSVNAYRNCVSGSSPQMRGALSVGCMALIYGRIIPADAGSTLASL